LELAVWRSAGALYNANLRNFCGPFTRSYHPDATRSVTMFSLWIWAVLGREYAPLPPLDAPVVDHGHDLMAGPVFDRLTRGSAVYDLSDFRSFGATRSVAQELARGRNVSAWVGPALMIGAESSGIDWGGWSQFMPATAHWRTARGRAVLWMVDAHEVHAVASDHRLRIDVPAGVSELRLRLLSTDPPNVEETAVVAAGMRVTFGAEISRVVLTGIGTDAYEIRATPATSTAGIRADIRFGEM
jgi:hypothetical protein